MEDNPSGQLNKEKMLDMYNAVLSLSKATKFVEDIFLQFDTDQNGQIDFKVGLDHPLTWTERIKFYENSKNFSRHRDGLDW